MGGICAGVEEGAAASEGGSVALEGAGGSWFQGFTTGSAASSPWTTAERAPEEQPRLPGEGVLLWGPSERAGGWSISIGCRTQPRTQQGNVRTAAEWKQTPGSPRGEACGSPWGSRTAREGVGAGTPREYIALSATGGRISTTF